MDPLLCPGGISAIILLPIEINLSHIVPQILQVARAKADVVADEEGGGSESRHDFGAQDTPLLVKEDVVTVASLVEVVHEIVDGNLYVVGYGVQRLVRLGDDIEFAEADARACRDVEVDIVFLVYGQSLEFQGVEGQVFVERVEADNLHVGVTQRTAREGAEILEEDDGLVLSRILHLLPVMHAETNEAVHVLGGIVGHVGVTDFALNENELVGVFDDVVLVLEQHEVAVCIDDAREIFTVTERTWGGLVDDIFRLFLAERRIETDEIDFHREDTSSFVTKST